MESIRIDILNPKARKLLEDLEALDLISIKSQADAKKEFFDLVNRLRSKKADISLDEITAEVEAVRKKNFRARGK